MTVVRFNAFLYLPVSGMSWVSSSNNWLWAPSFPDTYKGLISTGNGLFTCSLLPIYPSEDVNASFSQISAGAYLKPKSSPEIEGICQGCGAAAQMHWLSTAWGLEEWQVSPKRYWSCAAQVKSPTLAGCWRWPWSPASASTLSSFPRLKTLSLLLPGVSSDSGCRRVQLSDFKVWTASADGCKAWSGESMLWRYSSTLLSPAAELTLAH